MPGRRIKDWAVGVTEVADALGLERFAVLGVSGGAPYALACAKALQARVTALALVGGLGSLHPEDLAHFDLFARFVFGLITRSPPLGRALVHVIGMVLRARPDCVFSVLAGELPEADEAVLNDEDQRSMLVGSVKEGLRQGARGAAWDLTLYAQNSETEAEAFSMPVYIWHGERDTTVPCSMSRRLASRIACSAVFSRSHGHYSLPVLDIEQILRPLIEAP
jgi:pimeloyl-ACP methyl ester carboxylesterase